MLETFPAAVQPIGEILSAHLLVDHGCPNFARSRRRSIIVARLITRPASIRIDEPHPSRADGHHHEQTAPADISTLAVQSATRVQRGFVSGSSDRLPGIAAPLPPIAWARIDVPGSGLDVIPRRGAGQ